MTDAEISRRLALAIGWKADEGRIYHTGHGDEQRVEVQYTPRHVPSGYKVWRRFDYRDPSVIWPIAERFNAFPTFLLGSWTACIGTDFATDVDADTAAKAVALAVIKAQEGAKE